MKRLKNIYKSVCLLGLATVATTSCQDWLTVYPQTQIVEENFWEDKSDLEGVRYACYKNMCSSLEKIVLWGDLRSDSYDLNSSDESTSTIQLYQEIREGKIDRDSASTFFDWSGFYTTINYCNKVLQHGPEVLSNDKQFTSSEWLQMRAEITALRALNYFYLIRSFKDCPFSTKVVNSDNEVEYFGSTNQLVILDSLITDVESIKGQARNRFTETKDSKGMITNAAIYAMLSDMYLWRASLHQGRYGLESSDEFTINNVAEKMGQVSRHTVRGDYQLAISYADQAMSSLVQQTEDSKQGAGMGRNTSETQNYGLSNCNMIKNKFEGFKDGTVPTLTAYENIFTSGNSDESIFELQFNTSDSRSNGVVTSQWGYTTSNHLAVSDGALGAIYTSSEERNRDSRMWFSAWNRLSSETNALPGFYCFKWYGASVSSVPDSKQCTDIKVTTSSDGNSYRNWIVYRLSDVMLQRAEAMAAIGEGKEAMRYVNAIHRRWYCNDSKTDGSQPSTDVTDNNGVAFYSSSTAATLGNAPTPTQSATGITNYEFAVMNERQLEFLGEGKRWFDLVRFAERHSSNDGTVDPREGNVGNGKAGVDLMVDNFLRNQYSNMYQTLKNRFKNRYGLYNIIYYMEIKASVDENGVQHLEQNPVWNKSTYDK